MYYNCTWKCVQTVLRNIIMIFCNTTSHTEFLYIKYLPSVVENRFLFHSHSHFDKCMWYTKNSLLALTTPSDNPLLHASRQWTKLTKCANAPCIQDRKHRQWATNSPTKPDISLFSVFAFCQSNKIQLQSLTLLTARIKYLNLVLSKLRVVPNIQQIIGTTSNKKRYVAHKRDSSQYVVSKQWALKITTAKKSVNDMQRKW